MIKIIPNETVESGEYTNAVLDAADVKGYYPVNGNVIIETDVADGIYLIFGLPETVSGTTSAIREANVVGREGILFTLSARIPRRVIMLPETGEWGFSVQRSGNSQSTDSFGWVAAFVANDKNRAKIRSFQSKAEPNKIQSCEYKQGKYSKNFGSVYCNCEHILNHIKFRDTIDETGNAIVPQEFCSKYCGDTIPETLLVYQSVLDL